MKISKKRRESIKAMFGGRCAYCGCKLKDNWHADHVKPIFRVNIVKNINGSNVFVKNGKCVKKEHDCIFNIYPACAPCNLFKSVMSIETFRVEIGKQVERARKTSVNFRTAERFKQISVKEKPIVFWFETYLSKNESVRYGGANGVG